MRRKGLPRVFDGPEYRLERRERRARKLKNPVHLGLDVEAEVKAKLEQRAAEEGVSVAELVRRAIDRYLRGSDSPTPMMLLVGRDE